VGAHVALEVEVGQLITAGELQEGRQLGVGIDTATVSLILERIGADVGIDFASDFRSRHLGALILAQKRCQLITDERRLHKAAGGTIALAILALALLARLGGTLKLARCLLLQCAEFGLDGRNRRAELLQLGHEIGKISGH